MFRCPKGSRKRNGVCHKYLTKSAYAAKLGRLKFHRPGLHWSDATNIASEPTLVADPNWPSAKWSVRADKITHPGGKCPKGYKSNKKKTFCTRKKR